jgi:hypothetical protein
MRSNAISNCILVGILGLAASCVISDGAIQSGLAEGGGPR